MKIVNKLLQLQQASVVRDAQRQRHDDIMFHSQQLQQSLFG
jgi:hypothetical protein